MSFLLVGEHDFMSAVYDHRYSLSTPTVADLQLPGKSRNRTFEVPGFHFSGNRVNQELTQDSQNAAELEMHISLCQTLMVPIRVEGV
jgi:hypothetical protein